MFQSIGRIIINGMTGIFIYRVVYFFIGKYVVFVFYHINFALYWVCQSFLEPTTIRLISFIIIGYILSIIIVKLSKIISF